MRLKDRNSKQDAGKNPNSKGKGNKDICWHYNSGRCTYGKTCKFKHRCAIYNKFGHGAHICRKANSSKYQGVKEFHMLACIGCNCKIMVFSPFITYHHSSRGNK